MIVDLDGDFFVENVPPICYSLFNSSLNYFFFSNVNKILRLSYSHVHIGRKERRIHINKKWTAPLTKTEPLNAINIRRLLLLTSMSMGWEWKNDSYDTFVVKSNFHFYTLQMWSWLVALDFTWAVFQFLSCCLIDQWKSDTSWKRKKKARKKENNRTKICPWRKTNENGDCQPVYGR